MPAYYDEKTKSWYCKFYYTGTRKQKKKRGFKLQREAKEWERNFLETQQADLSMTFANFVKIYNEDMKHRLREHTFIQKQLERVPAGHTKKAACSRLKEQTAFCTFLSLYSFLLIAILVPK